MARKSLYPDELPLDQGDPKASSHRQWLLDVNKAIADLQWMVSLLTGGYASDGVVAFGGSPGDTGKVEETSPASMSVNVNAFAVFHTNCPFRIDADSEIGPFTPPVSGSRIDLIEANVQSQSLTVILGDGSTSTPAASSDGGVPLASITIASSATSIVNANIADLRTFLNYIPST